MSTRPIGELVAPIIAEAVGIARLQDFLTYFDHPADRKRWIMDWVLWGVISGAEAELLIEYNHLEAA